MSANHRSLCLSSVLLLGLAAPAQDINISHNNAVFTKDFETDRRNIFPSGGIVDFLRADPNGDAAGVLFKSAWIYRANRDIRETIFNDRPGQTVTYSNSGRVGTATWPDLDNRGIARAVATYRVTSTGANSGVVVATMEITNTGTSPLAITMFHFCDFDICGAGLTQNTSTSGADAHQMHAGGACTETADHYAGGIAGWESQTSGNLYGRFADTGSTTLVNNVGNVGPGDIRCAYEWATATILPGRNRTFVVEMTHNDRACGANASFYGPDAPISSGRVAVQVTTPPLLGQAVTWRGTNYVPATPLFLLTGIQAQNLVIPGLGITILNDALVAQNLPTPTTNTFTASLPIPNNRALCGAPLFTQFFYLDPLAPNGLAGHSRGSALILGSF